MGTYGIGMSLSSLSQSAPSPVFSISVMSPLVTKPLKENQLRTFLVPHPPCLVGHYIFPIIPKYCIIANLLQIQYSSSFSLPQFISSVDSWSSLLKNLSASSLTPTLPAIDSLYGSSHRDHSNSYHVCPLLKTPQKSPIQNRQT